MSKLYMALAASDVIEKTKLDEAQRLATANGQSLDRTLLHLGFVSEKSLLPFVAEVLEVPFFEVTPSNPIDKATLDRIDENYLKRNLCYPILNGDGSSTLLASDPSTKALSELRFLTGKKFALALASTTVLHEYFATSGTSSQKSQNSSDSSYGRHQSEAPASSWVSRLFALAVERGASDIHISQVEHGLTVRFRIHGLLNQQAVETGVDPNAIVARVKVLAGLNVSERRVPQDGRIGQIVAGKNIDVRVSTMPTQFGESIVARILDPETLTLSWHELGFASEDQSRITELIERPHGLFLITGTVGSGKTTTLYTALTHLNDGTRKIMTVEDPVEYVLPGIDQIQVNDSVGLTFPVALRATMRQDFNVLMVGEIRDPETAEIACRAAMIGRLVLATLHTRSASAAEVRLRDLGVPEYVINDVLIGTLGQSLTPAGCTDCKGIGCTHCQGTGSIGRKLETELFLKSSD